MGRNTWFEGQAQEVSGWFEQKVPELFERKGTVFCWIVRGVGGTPGEVRVRAAGCTRGYSSGACVLPAPEGSYHPGGGSPEGLGECRVTRGLPRGRVGTAPKCLLRQSDLELRPLSRCHLVTQKASHKVHW